MGPYSLRYHPDTSLRYQAVGLSFMGWCAARVGSWHLAGTATSKDLQLALRSHGAVAGDGRPVYPRVRALHRILVSHEIPDTRARPTRNRRAVHVRYYNCTARSGSGSLDEPLVARRCCGCPSRRWLDFTDGLLDAPVLSDPGERGHRRREQRSADSKFDR